MTEPVRIGIASFVASGLVVVVLLVSGAMAPVDLLFPGIRSGGAEVLIDDFGRESLPDRFAYDGQEIYVIAREFPDLDEAHRVGMPQVRMARLLHPLIAWIAPSGNATVLALMFGNLLGIGLAAGALADLAQRHGRRPIVGYAATLALAFPLAITTTEPLAFGLGLAGLAFADRNELIRAALLLSLAALGRETAVVMAVAAGTSIALVGARAKGLALVATALAPIALWSLWLRHHFPGEAQPVQVLGFLDLPPMSRTDVAAIALALLLTCVAVVRWRDIRILTLTAAGYLLACLAYMGESFQWEAFLRLSAVSIALGLAGLVPRTSPPPSPTSASVRGLRGESPFLSV